MNINRYALRSAMLSGLLSIFVCSSCETKPGENTGDTDVYSTPETVEVAAVCVGAAVDAGVLILVKNKVIAKAAATVAGSAVRKYKDVKFKFTYHGKSKTITLPEIVENTPTMVEVGKAHAYVAVTERNSRPARKVIEQVPPTCLLAYTSDESGVRWISHNADFATLNGVEVATSGTMPVEEIRPLTQQASPGALYVLEVQGKYGKDSYTLYANQVAEAGNPFGDSESSGENTAPDPPAEQPALYELELKKIYVRDLEGNDCEGWNFKVRIDEQTFEAQGSDRLCSEPVVEVNQVESLLLNPAKTAIAVEGRKGRWVLKGSAPIDLRSLSPGNFTVDVMTLQKEKRKRTKYKEEKLYLTFVFECSPREAM